MVFRRQTTILNIKVLGSCILLLLSVCFLRVGQNQNFHGGSYKSYCVQLKVMTMMRPKFIMGSVWTTQYINQTPLYPSFPLDGKWRCSVQSRSGQFRQKRKERAQIFPTVKDLRPDAAAIALYAAWEEIRVLEQSGIKWIDSDCRILGRFWLNNQFQCLLRLGPEQSPKRFSLSLPARKVSSIKQSSLVFLHVTKLGAIHKWRQ